MIDLKRAEVKGGSEEEKFIGQLTREGIPYRFGNLNNGTEEHKNVILTDRFAISFSPLSIGVVSTLQQNGFRPQVWHATELLWRELSLGRRLLLHK